MSLLLVVCYVANGRWVCLFRRTWRQCGWLDWWPRCSACRGRGPRALTGRQELVHQPNHLVRRARHCTLHFLTLTSPLLLHMFYHYIFSISLLFYFRVVWHSILLLSSFDTYTNLWSYFHNISKCKNGYFFSFVFVVSVGISRLGIFSWIVLYQDHILKKLCFDYNNSINWCQ